jgi:hypothetical protein
MLRTIANGKESVMQITNGFHPKMAATEKFCRTLSI